MTWPFGDHRLGPIGFVLARTYEPAHAEPQVLELVIHLVGHGARMVSKDKSIIANPALALVWTCRAFVPPQVLV